MPKNKSKNYYKKWILKIAKDETERTIRKHILKHADEIHSKDPKEWSASMRNLIEIFDKIYKLKPNLKLRIERLNHKYKKNPKRYTAPPR